MESQPKTNVLCKNIQKRDKKLILCYYLNNGAKLNDFSLFVQKFSKNQDFSLKRVLPRSSIDTDIFI